MFRWAITKGYITLIPPNARTSVGVDVDELSKSLDAGMKTNCFFQCFTILFYRISLPETMAEFEDLDEGLKSSWAPSVEDDDQSI